MTFAQRTSKYGSVTTLLVAAIASDGEARVFRQCRKNVQQMRLFGLLQFGLETPRKGIPSSAVIPNRRITHQRGARGEIRQPDVEPVTPLRLANAARRAPNRSNAQAFTTQSRRSQLHDSDWHEHSECSDRSLFAWMSEPSINRHGPRRKRATLGISSRRRRSDPSQCVPADGSGGGTGLRCCHH